MKNQFNSVCYSPDGSGGGSAVVAAESDVGDTAVAPASAIKYELEEFIDGDYKGFKFTSPEFGNVGTAIDTYGEAIVLSVFNSAITARLRTKVKNGLKKNLKPAELTAEHQALLTKYPDGVLFTAEDATKWRPEVRELTPNQLFKRSKLLFTEAAKLTPGSAEHTAKLQEAQQALMDMAKSMQG